jgi:hypothetical protein
VVSKSRARNWYEWPVLLHNNKVFDREEVNIRERYVAKMCAAHPTAFFQAPKKEHWALVSSGNMLSLQSRL